MSSRSVVIRFIGDAGGLSSAARQGQQSVSKFAAGSQKALKVAQGAALAFAAGTVAALKSGVEGIKEGEEAQARLAQAVSRLPAAVRVSTQAMQAQAEQIQKLTRFTYEDALAVDAFLVAQDGVQGALRSGATTMAELTQTTLDLATVQNVDGATAAKSLAKWLAAPEKAAGALRKAGINLSAQQQAAITSWVKSGDTANAYGLIMDEVKAKVTGAATAAGETTEGQLLRAQAAWGEVKESLAVELLPVVNSTVGYLLQFSNWAQEHPGKVQGAVIAIGTLAAVIGTVTVATKVMAAWQAIAAAITFLAWSPILGPFVIITAAVVGLGAAFVLLWKKAEWFRNIVIGVWNKLVGITGAAIKGIVSFYAGYIDVVLSGFQKILEGLGHIPDWLGGGKFDQGAQAIANLRGNIANAVNDINAQIDRVVDVVKIDVVVNYLDASQVGSTAALKNEFTAEKLQRRAAASQTPKIPKPVFTGGSFTGGGGGGGGAKVAKVAKAAKKTGQEILDAFLQGMNSRFPLVEDRLRKFSDGVGVNLGHGLGKVVASTEKTLGQLQTKLDVLAGSGRGSIEAAKQKLEDARKVYSDFRESVRSSLSDLGNLGTHGGGTFEIIRDRLQQSLDNAKDFTATMAALTKAGLKDSALQQLIAQGPGKATETGKALLAAGKAGIGQITELQSQIDSVAERTAKAQADQFFAAGIRQAEGVVEGLKSKQAALNEQMRKAGNALVEAVKKGLGLKVTDTGLKVAGKRAGGGPVTAGRSYLVGENGPELFTPRTSGAVAANGGAMQVNIVATGPTLRDIVRVEVSESNRALRTAVLAGRRA